jgi:hypothetical protein
MGKKSIQKPEESAISKLKRILKNPKSLSHTRSYRKPAKTADTNSRISSAPKIDRTERERERDLLIVIMYKNRKHQGLATRSKRKTKLKRNKKKKNRSMLCFALFFPPKNFKEKPGNMIRSSNEPMSPIIIYLNK